MGLLRFRRNTKAAAVGAVPTSRTVNGKALSADITLAAADVSAVPTTRTVNAKALSANITLTNTDVGAAATSHTHAAGDVTSGTLAVARLGTGTPAAGKYVDGGTGAWTALPSGGGGSGGPLFTPPVGWYFSSPLLFNGTTNKPSGFLAPCFIPGYGGAVTIDEVSVNIDTADAAGGNVTVTIKAAGADGLATSTVLSTTSHATTTTGRRAAASSFTIPATGAWCYVSTFTGTGRLRVANGLLLASNMGASSAQATALTSLNDDPNNSSGSPIVVVLHRSA